MNGTVFDAPGATGTLAQAGFDDRRARAVADLDAGLAALRAAIGKLETRLAVRLFGAHARYGQPDRRRYGGAPTLRAGGGAGEPGAAAAAGFAA